MTENIVVIRLRGRANIKPKIKRTMEMLRLSRPNHCVVIVNSPQNMGMINVVKDYVAFGKIADATLSKLVLKRGEEGKDHKGFVFRLHPPKKGLKDLKLHWPEGALGKRDDMDTFIVKMM